MTRKWKNNRALLIVVLVFTSLAFSGCLNVTDEFISLRNTILSRLSNNYKKEAEFSVDSFGLSMAKTFVKFSNSQKKTDRILRNVKTAQIGTYKLKDANGAIQNYRQIIAAMEKKKWRYFYRRFSPSETDIVFAKISFAGRCEDIFVVSLAHSELNLVEAHGNMDKVIEEIIGDNNFKMSFIGKR
jgi:hypothetical protein